MAHQVLSTFYINVRGLRTRLLTAINDTLSRCVVLFRWGTLLLATDVLGIPVQGVASTQLWSHSVKRFAFKGGRDKSALG